MLTDRERSPARIGSRLPDAGDDLRNARTIPKIGGVRFGAAGRTRPLLEQVGQELLRR